MLAVLNAIQNSPDKGCGSEHVINTTAKGLGQGGDRQGGRLLMDVCDDLYRAGVVSYGLDMSNLGFGWAHLTQHGVESLENVDRDRASPTGYLIRALRRDRIDT